MPMNTNKLIYKIMLIIEEDFDGFPPYLRHLD